MNSTDKIASKRQSLIERTATALAVTPAEAERLFAIDRKSSFRINTVKVEDDLSLLAELANSGWQGLQSAIYADGYTIAAGRDSVVRSTASLEGRIFIQNQSSWLPVIALDPQPGETILDMCAAPGGKASHMAELAGVEAKLWVNDSSKARLFKLRSIFKRLDVRYAQQTMYTIDRLPHVLGGQLFDKILLDAPCSGEGLIDINSDKDFEYWSLAQIKRLQQLQKKGIQSAWKLLKPGGTLVYSTCTMAPEENEAVVNYLLTRQPDAELRQLEFKVSGAKTPVQEWNGKTYTNDLSACLRLPPSEFFEAFFVGKLHKSLIDPGNI